jgi:predicted transport protein
MRYIDPKLRDSNWDLEKVVREYSITKGKIVPEGKGGRRNDPKNIAIDISNRQVHTPCEYRVFVDDKSDLEYVITLIRQAYEKAN